MANLGSDNTPIEGESFGLPSGYSFDEENGDLVVRDTDGTVAMRRADGTWELESDLALNENDISGVGAFDSESVNTEDARFDGTPWFDIRNYGAESGQNVTDAFEDAFDAVESAGAGRVYIPNGDWYIDPVFVPSGCKIIWQSTEAVVIAESQPDEEWTLFDVRDDEPENIWLEGPGRIDGNSDAHDHPKGDDPNKGDLIELDSLENGGVTLLTIEDAPAEAIDFDRASDVSVSKNTCLDCGGWGIHISQESEASRVIDNHVEGCGFELNRGGIDQHSSALNNTFVGNIAKDNRKNYEIDGSGAQFNANKNIDTGDVEKASTYTGVGNGRGVMIEDRQEDVDSFSLTAEGINRVERGAVVIEVNDFRATDAGAELRASVEGTDGSVQTVLVDETLTTETLTFEDHFVLIETTAGEDEGHIGKWWLSISRARPGIHGTGSYTEAREGKYLHTGGAGSTASDPYKLTVEAINNDGEVTADVSIGWEATAE